ncbi:MAG: hypothetical protein ACRDK3_09375 [Actinomycetota bacterium]
MRRLLLAGAALAVLVAGAWWASGSDEPPRPPQPSEASPSPSSSKTEEPPDPLTAASDLLTERAQAVRDGDSAAFLSSIDPAAKRFRKQQHRIFRRVRTLRFETYDLDLQVSESDLARRKHRRRYKRAEDVFIARVEESYRFKRYDDADFVGDLFFTFVLRDGRWLIAADDDLRGRTTTARNLWDFGPVKWTRSKNVIVIQHPCRATACVEVGDSFLQLAENARRRVMQRWRERWNGRVVVLVTSSRKELRQVIDVDFAISNFVAFAYTPHRARGYSPARIVVDRETLNGRSSGIVEMVLTHELVHVATRRASGPNIPLWVEEGLAEWVSRTAGDDADLYYSSQVASGAVRARLPRDRDFRRGDAERLFLQYQSSRTAVEYFIERFGYQQFVRFYKRLGDSHDEPGTRAEQLGSAMRRITGLSMRRFERQWADSI